MTDFVALGLARNPAGIAIEDGQAALTYRELDRRVSAVARGLADSGVGPGDLVAARMAPTTEGIILIHGVRRAGAVLTPMHPGWTEHELRAALDALAPALVLDDPSDLEPAADGSSPPDVEPSDVAAILWTSGTGGRRRGVEITGRALSHSARACAGRLGLVGTDRWYASLQPAHVGGLALIVRAALLGSRVIASSGFDASRLADLSTTGSVTHASLVPVMLRSLLEHQPRAPETSAVRAFLVGGARAPERLVRRAVAGGWPVSLTYGATETTSQVATAPPDEVAKDPRSVGHPLDGVDVTIAADGEILVRGPTLARRYHGATDDLTDPDGWYHTGDMGTLGADGRLRVGGRRTGRIVSGGLTVDPDEVAVVLRECDGVEECAVVGVPDPDWGELVAAGLVPAHGRSLDLDAVRAHQAARLASGARARRLRILTELPRNANGKVDRVRLRTLLGADESI